MKTPMLFKPKMTVYVLLLAAAIAAMVALRHCDGAGQRPIPSDRGDTLYVAIEYGPMSLYMYDDTLGGFNHDLLGLIAKREGIVVTFKPVVSIDEIAAKLGDILETIQKDLYVKAKAFLDDHISTATTMDEMKDAVQNKKGFVKAMWCGEEECEDEVKAQTGGVTSRCIPVEEEQLSDVCVCCGKPAKHMVYWGRAY